jgi:hypothetical protein
MPHDVVTKQANNLLIALDLGTTIQRYVCATKMGPGARS